MPKGLKRKLSRADAPDGQVEVALGPHRQAVVDRVGPSTDPDNLS